MVNTSYTWKIYFLSLAGLLFCLLFTATASALVSISSFTAVPDTIDPGGTSTLSWTTTDATSCQLNGNAVSISGNMPVTPSTNTTYTITCQGNGGPVTESVLVKVRFIIEGKIKTPVGGNPLANDVAVKYIMVIVMATPVLGGVDYEEGRGFTDENGDFSISFTDVNEPYIIFINVEYIGQGVDGKLIEVRSDHTDFFPMKDSNIAPQINASPGR